MVHLRGISVKALKKNEEVVETLEERIVGRTSLNDVYTPTNRRNSSRSRRTYL